MPDTQHTTEIDVQSLWEPIFALAEAEQAAPLNQYVGAWHCRIDDRWRIAVNAHNYRVDVTPDGAMAATMEPFQCAVWFNGWLAGTFNPAGGWFADGEAGNVRTFMAAVRKRVQP